MSFGYKAVISLKGSWINPASCNSPFSENKAEKPNAICLEKEPQEVHFVSHRSSVFIKNVAMRQVLEPSGISQISKAVIRVLVSFILFCRSNWTWNPRFAKRKLYAVLTFFRNRSLHMWVWLCNWLQRDVCYSEAHNMNFHANFMVE
jgi:hypothetical protein